uniref:Uncharacterized protein n=1 Tax=Rhizophora mucronata TaxID=61149 RepID=A0A2P2L701_RHIMU
MSIELVHICRIAMAAGHALLWNTQ